MVTNMMASGILIKLMGKVFILLKMDQGMKELSIMTSRMVKESRHGLREQYTKVSINKVESMVRANINGKKVQLTMDSGVKVRSTVMELLSGQMVNNILVNGYRTKCPE